MINRLNFTMLYVATLVALHTTLVFADPPVGSPPGLQRAKEVQERNTDNLMARIGVVGTAIGLNAAGQPILKIFTENRNVPGLPAVLEGFPVQVEMTGKFRARVDRTARFARPVPIGVSIGHIDVTAGTLGSQVFKVFGSGHSQTTVFYALSNNHVMANSNNATIGDGILQPGPLDGGQLPTDVIGNLFAFKPIVWCVIKRGRFGGCKNGTPADNRIDAAIASTNLNLVGSSTPADGYGLPRQTVIAAVVGMNVMKYGRTTGQTTGQVDAINAIVDVQYSVGFWARYGGQIILTPGAFSSPGDSGSLIVVADGADERKPVGLLFAGSDTFTAANPIGEVLSEFRVTISGNF